MLGSSWGMGEVTMGKVPWGSMLASMLASMLGSSWGMGEVTMVKDHGAEAPGGASGRQSHGDTYRVPS